MLASGLTDKAFDSGIKGRTLLIRSKDILKNCKKALAVVLRHDSPYKSYASTGLLPSGMCIEDYFLQKATIAQAVGKTRQAAYPSQRGREANEEKKLNKKVEVKQEAGSATDSSMHRSGNQQGTSASNDYTINQQLQIAAMAQSKIVINNRERSDLSDRIVAMHTSKVAEKVLIEELKFMIMNTSSDDPDRAVYMKDLKVLHRELGSALDELLQSEQSIIDAASKTLQLKQQAIAVASSPRSTKEGFHKLYNNVLVDLTISSPAASTSVFTATPNCNSRINGGDDNNDVADNVAAS
ncbi:hypothetical protein MHU86_10388 [Fragilaria crotonensis]|nr:hypothetical protein MHU86_10388 [Fragilaria crotonensis]